MPLDSRQHPIHNVVFVVAVLAMPIPAAATPQSRTDFHSEDLAITQLITSTAAFSAASGDSDQHPAPDAPIALSVRLSNHADVRGFVIGAAQQQVSRIYAAAGITIIWTADPSNPCAVDVLVLSPAMSDLMIRLEGIPRRVLGVANLNAQRAYILTERVVDSANAVGVEPGDALGHVIAHELGHLLLKGVGHSSSGVMQPGYEFRNRSARRFTPEQAVMLRQEMQRRR
jgi:hypothetical protein